MPKFEVKNSTNSTLSFYDGHGALVNVAPKKTVKNVFLLEAAAKAINAASDLEFESDGSPDPVGIEKPVATDNKDLEAANATIEALKLELESAGVVVESLNKDLEAAKLGLEHQDGVVASLKEENELLALEVEELKKKLEIDPPKKNGGK